MLEGEREISSEAHVNAWARGGRAGCNVRLRVRAQRVRCGAKWPGRSGQPWVVCGRSVRGAAGVTGDIGSAVCGVCGEVCRAVVEVKRESRRSHGEGKKQRPRRAGSEPRGSSAERHRNRRHFRWNAATKSNGHHSGEGQRQRRHHGREEWGEKFKNVVLTTIEGY